MIDIVVSRKKRREYEQSPKRKAYRKAWEKNEKRQQYLKNYRKINKEKLSEKRLERYKQLVKPKKHYGSNVNHKLGNQGETLSLKLLVGSKKINRPSDILWNGKYVEVKTSIKSQYYTKVYKTMESVRGRTYRWKFLLNQLRNVDYFLFVLKDLDEKIVRILLIPDKDIKVKNFQISESGLSKYDKYIMAI